MTEQELAQIEQGAIADSILGRLVAEVRRLKQTFEEAREIIAQVSYSPEFKKWHYGGQEQDPCGVHAFTAKHADKPVPMCRPDPLEDIMPPVTHREAVERDGVEGRPS